MAFNPRKIFPLDTKLSVAIGIGLPFNQSGVFKSTYLTKDAIKANLINFFLTNRKERFLNNNFGANLRAFIFEQITSGNLSNLKDDIQGKINQMFSNIRVENLEINQFPDTNSINMILSYSIPNTNITDKVEITF
jgi:phage baseplate assembly protein W